MNIRDEGGNFLKGAMLGGVLCGLAGLLLAPKSGKDLCDSLSCQYDNLHKKARNFIQSTDEEEDTSNLSTFLIGGVVGGVLGVAAALLLAPGSGTELRKALGDKYEDIYEQAEDFVDEMRSKGKHTAKSMEDWKNTLVSVVNKLSSSKVKKQAASKVHEILDYAQLGARLWNEFQSRR